MPRPEGYLRALGAHVTDFAGQYTQWPTVRWRVGTGVGPEGLSLACLQDGAAYHFDLKQPLRPEARSESSRAAGVESEAPSWQRQDWHADQLRLMPESGHTSAQ